jgi:Putative transposase, YhgA-like
MFECAPLQQRTYCEQSTKDLLTQTMPNHPGHIHDSFFKRALRDPGRAGTFLREHLPADVAELLGPEPPELMAGSFDEILSAQAPRFSHGVSAVSAL